MMNPCVKLLSATLFWSSLLLVSPVVADAATTLSADSTETTVAHAGFVSGPLSVSAPTLTPSFYVTSTTANIAYTEISPIHVLDARGTGAGWHVTVMASPLIGQALHTNSSVILPQGSLFLSSPSVTSNNGPYVISPPIVNDSTSAIDESSPVTITSAPARAGMGKWTLTFPTNNLQLKLGAAAQQFIQNQTTPVVFTTTLTWNVSTGP
jgi:WxL domain surface cell wall-binding